MLVQGWKGSLGRVEGKKPAVYFSRFYFTKTGSIKFFTAGKEFEANLKPANSQ